MKNKKNKINVFRVPAQETDSMWSDQTLSQSPISIECGGWKIFGHGSLDDLQLIINRLLGEKNGN
jgi:hypothetical protein